mmetsp:Transcript_21897/g.64474  ORF Transcript_21897/g.64474 Transcript_21897/m.64474 type:complete len:278 (-) Transcript_21897:560-1393(-)
MRRDGHLGPLPFLLVHEGHVDQLDAVHLLVVVARELVARVDEELDAEHLDRFSDPKVGLCECLHRGRVNAAAPPDVLRGVRGGRVDARVRVDVLVNLALLDKEREWVAPVVPRLDLDHLHVVVGEVVVQDEGAQLAIQLLTVVPRHVEAEHLAVVVQELAQPVALEEVRRGAEARLHPADERVVHGPRPATDVSLDRRARRGVPVGGLLDRLRHLDPELLEECSREAIAVGQREDAAVDVDGQADVEVGRTKEIALWLGDAVALEVDGRLCGVDAKP